MGNISIVDTPLTKSKDLLETQSYAKALSEFVQNCETPLTIGIQGEWGSGKTSLLNMIQTDLSKASEKLQKKSHEESHDYYKVIWINTWEHSVLKSPEESLISIVEELVDTISAIDGSFDKAQKAKQYLSQIAKGALRIGAQATLGSKAAQVTEEVLGGSSNSIKGLRKSLEDIIKTIVLRKQNPIGRFVIFIDDLDRIDPENAVEVLELLKNIFSVEHCVYVLAIDYQVVVKGLKGKFGELTEENEWEFRAYFDKIIQLPFMMPMGSYNLTKYLEGILIETGFYTSANKRDYMTAYLTQAVKYTIGHNPRALKRLANSLSMINIHWKIKGSNYPKTCQKEETFKQVMFCLVCIQISFPKIFQLLQANPNFSEWDDDFVSRYTQGRHEVDQKLNESLALAKEHNSPDFDEEWEQAIFKIVWYKKWQSKRLIEISRVLTIIKDNLLGADDINEKAFTDVMTACLKITSVTSVSALSETTDAEMDQEKENLERRQGRYAFWNSTKKSIQNINNIMGNYFKAKKGNHASSAVFTSSKNGAGCYYAISCRTSNFIKLEVFDGDKDENIALFKFLKLSSDSIESAINSKLKFTIKEDSPKQEVRVICSDKSIPQRHDMSNKKSTTEDLMVNYINNIVKTQPLFEKKIEELCGEFNNLSSNDREALLVNNRDER